MLYYQCIIPIFSLEAYDKMKLALQALDQAAQGGRRVPIPGGVQKMCRCATSGHGLAGVGVLG